MKQVVKSTLRNSKVQLENDSLEPINPSTANSIVNRKADQSADRKQIAMVVDRNLPIAVDYVVGKYFDSINQGLYRQAVSLFAPKGILAPPFHPQIVGQEQIHEYFLQQPSGLHIETQTFDVSPFHQKRTKVNVSGIVRINQQEINTTWTFLIDKSAKITILQEVILLSLQELEAIQHSYPFQDFKLDCFEPEYLGGQACVRVVTKK